MLPSPLAEGDLLSALLTQLRVPAVRDLAWAIGSPTLLDPGFAGFAQRVVSDRDCVCYLKRCASWLRDLNDSPTALLEFLFRRDRAGASAAISNASSNSGCATIPPSNCSLRTAASGTDHALSASSTSCFAIESATNWCIGKSPSSSTCRSMDQPGKATLPLRPSTALTSN